MNAFTKRVAFLLLTSVVAAGVAAALHASTAKLAGVQATNDAIRPDQVESVLRAVDAAKKDVRRETFDPRAIVGQVGNDAGKILEWVRENTYWVAYRGALRGSTGVLMDRLGNSVDRSLLLAELLRVAGHKVQLARRSLTQANARLLLQQTRPVPSDPLRRAPWTQDQMNAAIARYAQVFQVNAAQLATSVRLLTQQSRELMVELGKRVESQAPFLAGRAGTPQAPAAEPDDALAAMTDHWWVRRQDGDRWIDLDPQQPAAAPAQMQNPEETFPFDKSDGVIPLPSARAQEMTIRVIVEKWRAGKVTEQPALVYTFRPADVLGQPIVLGHVPLKWPTAAALIQSPDRLAAAKAAALAQTEWLPVLTVGSRQIRQSSFTSTGDLNVNPLADGARKPPAAQALGGAMDALGGGEETPPPGGELTAEWIEYEIRVPGKPPRTIRRDVFDVFDQQPRSGPIAKPTMDDRTRTERALKVLGTMSILPLVSRPSRDYVNWRMLEEQTRDLRAIVGLAASIGKNDLAASLNQAGRIAPSSEKLLRLAVARFEWSPVQASVFLDAPNILSYRNALSLDPSNTPVVRQGFDIIANHIAVHPSAAGSAFSIRVAQGVADTNAEALLLGNAMAGNAGSLLASLGRSENSWITIRDAGDSASARVNFPKDVAGRITQSVRDGYIVVAPRTPGAAGATGHWAWWRIHPTTGETLGIGEAGWGQALVELLTSEGMAMTVMIGTVAWLHVCLFTMGRQPNMTMNQFIGHCNNITFGGSAAIPLAILASLYSLP